MFTSVIGGTASQGLARKIARKLKARYLRVELKVFPDGESKVTIYGKPRGRIIVVQSTYPPVDSNLIQALALISKAREYSSNIIAVIPYFGYARQDKEFLPGEIVTMKVVAKLFKAAGTSKIVIVDVHSKTALRHFKIPVVSVSAVPELARYFRRLDLENPLVVSPDFGGIARAREFANLLNVGYTALLKRRDRKTGKVEIKSSRLRNVIGRDIVMVDDMVSTGDSIIKATEFLKKQKCGRIFVACTHALLINDAEKRIRQVGVSKIISTNTIPKNTAVVDSSEIIVKTIS